MQRTFGRRLTGKQGWAVGIFLAALVGVIVVLGYLVEPVISVTGFGEMIFTRETTQLDAGGDVIRTDRVEDPRRAKTLWDWLQLLVVPAALAILSISFNQRQNQRARETENQRAQDAALQAYLGQMSELLIDKGIRDEPRRYGDTRVTARARTLTILSQLEDKDKDRKPIVLRFLREARLINRKEITLEGRTIYDRYVGLWGADLSNANLRKFKLVDAALEGTNLQNTDLANADLSGADLRGATLHNANLEGATLEGCDFGTFVPDDGSEPTRTDLRARGLDPKQLERALGDTKTQLPDYINHPEAWSKGTVE